jgi:hypothetical protein
MVTSPSESSVKNGECDSSIVTISDDKCEPLVDEEQEIDENGKRKASGDLYIEDDRCRDQRYRTLKQRLQDRFQNVRLLGLSLPPIASQDPQSFSHRLLFGVEVVATLVPDCKA